MQWLTGKKTIIVQILAIAGIAGAWLGGTISTEDALKSIWLAFTALFLAVKANRMINGK